MMINKNSSDIEIIDSILIGNDIHFKFLIDRYKNKVFGLVFRIVKNRLDAEEISQDVFIKVYNSLGQFKFESKFSTWLYRISYNTSLTFLRNNNLKFTDEENLECIEDNLNNEHTFEKLDLKMFINKIINKLPTKYSLIITLYYLNEMTYDEISKLTDDSISNVKIKLHRARILLKNLIIKNKYVDDVL